MAAERRESFFIFYIIAFVVVLLAAGGVYWLWHGKQSELGQESKERNASADKGPLIATAMSTRGPDVRKVTIVGEALPYKTATLYAKVSGYLARIAVDAGDHVKQGQFIAEITSPEIDSQFRAASAALENKERLEKRTRDLADKGFFSQQALDNAETDVRTQSDAVKEIRTMQGYRTLSAPFAGVVTARYADVGALVTNATSNRTSAQPVVTISDTSRLRVTIYVDQTEANYVKIGTDVEITDSLNPEIKAKGKVSRTSGQLDPRTRTMQTQVDFDNSKNVFISGSFVVVAVLIPAKSFIEVPSGALIQREGKTFVGVVDAENKVKFTPVNIASTDGKVLRIAEGLAEGQRVTLNLPNTIADGSKVNPAPLPPTAAAPAPAAPTTPPPAGTASTAPPPPPAAGAPAAGNATPTQPVKPAPPPPASTQKQ